MDVGRIVEAGNHGCQVITGRVWGKGRLPSCANRECSLYICPRTRFFWRCSLSRTRGSEQGKEI